MINHTSLRRRHPYVFPLVILLLSLALPLSAPGAAPVEGEEAGMLEVTVQVDGLACPFCAYGLEKKLRKVNNVAELEIRVDEGRAVLKPAEGSGLDLQELERAVRDGGFTPRRMDLVARGRLGELNGAPVIELPDDTLLLLADDGETRALLEAASSGSAPATDQLIRVEGQAERRAADGHAGHPYTLVLSSFEIV